MRLQRSSFLFTAALLLQCLAFAAAHGHDGNNFAGGEPIDTAEAHAKPSAGPKMEATSYFAYGEHSGAMLGHVVSMIIAWFFVLPIGTWSVVFGDARANFQQASC